MDGKQVFKQHEELLDSINFVHDRIHEALNVLERQRERQTEPNFVDTAIIELKEALKRLGH